MASPVIASITYEVSNKNGNGGIQVDKLRVSRLGKIKRAPIHMELLGTGYLNHVSIQLTPELAMALAGA